jgi:hypothetical protein
MVKDPYQDEQSEIFEGTEGDGEMVISFGRLIHLLVVGDQNRHSQQSANGQLEPVSFARGHGQASLAIDTIVGWWSAPSPHIIPQFPIRSLWMDSS